MIVGKQKGAITRFFFYEKTWQRNKKVKTALMTVAKLDIILVNVDKY